MIKNIIFDIDGVLVDSNLTYLEFLRNTYERFKDIVYDDLPVLFPMSHDNGCIKLPADLSAQFRFSPYYSYRPLFPDTLDVLGSLCSRGYRLFTLSAARNPDAKLQCISGIFDDIFDAFEFSPAGDTKELALINMLNKYSLDKSETMFIDDRFQQVRAGLSVGVHVVRMAPQISLPLPPDLSYVKSVGSMTEFDAYLRAINK